MKELNSILSEAAANVGEIYFHLRIDGGDAPIFRERVYCRLHLGMMAIDCSCAR